MIRFVFIFFSLFTHSQPKEACLATVANLYKAHSKESVSLNKPENPYSAKLNSILYEEINNTSLLSHKEKKQLLKELKQTISYLENKELEQADKTKRDGRLKALEPTLLNAIQAVPSIITFLEKNSNPYLDKKQALNIILITLTKYVRVYLNHPEKESDIDFKRFEKILSSIEKFNENAFSVYQIIRSVKEKYSLYEYLNCK